MSSDSNPWYRLGYLFAQAREGPSQAHGALSELAGRVRDVVPGTDRGRNESRFPLPDTDQIVAAGLAAVTARLLSAWRPRHATGIGDLIRAGLTGAGAALLVELARPLLRGDAELPSLDDGTFDRIVAGVAQGLVYGAVVEPRLPGPGIVRGAIFGAVEYAAVPMGGLGRVFGRATPQGRIPVVGRVLEGMDGRDRAFLEHLAFGVVIGVLYGTDE